MAVALACRSSRERPAVRSGPDDGAAPAALDIEWAGCSVVRVGPVCELGSDRRLTVWTPGDARATVRFEIDGRPGNPETAVRIQDGWRFAFTIPPGARRIVASATVAADGRPAVLWSLPLATAADRHQIEALLASGKHGETEAAAKQLLDIAVGGPVVLRGAAIAAYARLQLHLGNGSEAEAAFRRALAAARAEGRASDEMRDGHALIWALTEREQRFADARAVLNSLPAAEHPDAEGQVLLAYSRGLVAAATGDLREALTSYRMAARLAERLDVRPLAGRAATELARVLVLLERPEDAAPILASLSEDADPCAEATRAVTRAWALMESSKRSGEGRLRSESGAHPGGGSDESVQAALGAAHAAARRCPDARVVAFAAVNAAEHALAAGDADNAAPFVDELRGMSFSRDATLAAWRADVLGSWLLARDRAAPALRAFQEQVRAARAAGLGEEEFRGEIGMGRALLASRTVRAAVTHFKNAQAILERMMSGIPVLEGQGRFLAGHDQAVRFLIDALVENGEAAEAMRVARVSRSSEIMLAARLDRLSRLSSGQRRSWDDALSRYAQLRRALEEEASDDWKLPRSALERARAAREERAERARATLDEAFGLLVEQRRGPRILSRPGPSDLYLGLFPGVKSWIAFAQSDHATSASRISGDQLSTPSSAGAAAVLARFAPELEGVHRVRIFASGVADSIEWEEVPWRSAPLISAVEVEYGQDIGGASSRGGTTTADVAPVALVLGNPTGDLAAAQLEVTVVSKALVGWRTDRLDGKAATRDALLAHLSDAQLFHFAGHATVSSVDGRTSALLLANGTHVDMGDLLALSHVPDLVVLSACEAAGTASSQGSPIGLGQAFIASGTRAVIAPTRPVGDTDARAFISRLYSGFDRGRPDRISAAFRQAAKLGSHSFRLMVQ